MSDQEDWDKLNARGAASVARQTKEFNNIEDAPVGSYRRARTTDGRVVFIAEEDTSGHKNPPLHELNKADKETSKALHESQRTVALDNFHAFQRTFRKDGRDPNKMKPLTAPRPEFKGSRIER